MYGRIMLSIYDLRINGLMRSSNKIRPDASVRWLAAAFLVVPSACVIGVAGAADSSDALNLVVSQSFQHDDNIYRLPDGVSPYGDGQREDLISITGFSALFDRVYSRQRLYASLDVARVGFDEWSDLDYTTKGGSIGWDWAMGSRWSGGLSVKQDEVARDFSDVGSNRRESSINRRITFDASADYWWHPDWAVGVGFERHESSYSDEQSQHSDYRASIPEISLTYRPETGNRLSLQLRQTDGEYPKRIVSAVSDVGYRQSDGRVSGSWHLTGHSRVTGYLGYTRRTYSNLSVRDFSGMTGRLQHEWTATGKLSLRTIVRREIGAREDLTDNFVVTKAFSLEPTWAATSRIALKGLWELRQRDYGGDPGLVTGASEQDDVTRMLRFSLSYSPFDNLHLSVAHTRASRSGDRALNEYSAETNTVAMQYSF